MSDIDKFVEVDRKAYLTLLAPIAEKMGVDLHNVTGGRMDHSGIEFEYVDRDRSVACRRTARIHVFDPVVF